LDKRLAAAQAWLNREEPDEALALCHQVMNDCPDDLGALHIAGHAYIKAERWGMAYQMYWRATQLHPASSESWNNMGRCLQELGRVDEAEAVFRRCIDMSPDDYAACNNMVQTCTVAGRHGEAVYWYKEALKRAKDENDRQEARMNVGLSLLATRQWEEGWTCYDAGLQRNKCRPDISFKGEPRWNGEPHQGLVVYAEQGLGEEILFGSMIPDLLADKQRNAQVVIECDPKMSGLFSRALKLPVYGTRFSKERSWTQRHRITSHVAMGSLGRFYRTEPKMFPARACLRAEPQRSLMYRTLLEQLGPGRTIGLAWTGGRKNTGAPQRSIGLAQFAPLAGDDVHLISLQYCDPAKDIADCGFRVHHFPFATETQDYDDTAALVSNLDAVVCVTTAVAHLCGALGVRCHVLVPEHPQWHWNADGPNAWWSSVEHYRQGKDEPWSAVIARVEEVLRGDRARSLEAAE